MSSRLEEFRRANQQLRERYLEAKRLAHDKSQKCERCEGTGLVEGGFIPEACPVCLGSGRAPEAGA